MDRRNRTLAGVGLALTLTLTGTGCRSTRSEVPRGRLFSGHGQAPPPVQFGSSPAGTNGFSALPGGTGEGLPSQNSAGQIGTPPPGSGNYGVPTGNAFGPPGTSTLATPPSSSLGAPAQGGSDPLAIPPQAGAGSAGPIADPISSPPASPPDRLPAPTPNPFQ